MKQRLLLTLTAVLFALGSWADGTEIDGICYILDEEGMTASVASSGGTSYSGSIAIPSSVTYGGTPYTVTGIGSSAFYGCTGLTSVTIPESVTEIGASAFRGCTSLTSVIIPASVNYFGAYSFYGCTGLTSVAIPCPEAWLGRSAFSGCTNLKSVAFNSNRAQSSYFTSIFGNQVEELILGEACTKIPNGANSFPNLTSVTVHSDNITPSAFGSQVKRFTFGEGVTQIAQKAFFPGFPAASGGELTFQPTALEEVWLPSTLRTIGGWAFQFCINLKRVHFQEGLDSIGSGAFTYCLSLESLNLSASLRKLGDGQSWLIACKEITVPEGNPYIMVQDGVLFDKAMTTLLQYPAAREGEAYRIPDGVKTVQGYAFEGNANLKSLTIPASVDSMGMNWFAYTRPDEIRMESSVPPRSANSSLWFDNQGLSGSWLYPAYDFENSVTLYVPRGSKEIYANTAPWSSFANIVEYDVTAIQPVTLSQTIAGTACYNLQGQRITRPQRGQVVVIRYADGTSRKVLVK